MLNRELAEVDNHLTQIAGQLNLLRLISPVNISTEKEKFMADSNYNPQFEYELDLSELAEVEARLENLIIDESTWQGFLLNEVKIKFLQDCHFAQQIGGDLDEFIQVNQLKYNSKADLPDEEILHLAESKIVKGECLQKEKKYEAQRVKDIFDAFLKEKKINWNVVVDCDLVPLLSVNYFTREIKLNPLIQLSQIELERMLIHEIETHLYSYLNGKNLFQMAAIALKDYEKTAEGLAAYNESLVFPEDKSFLKRFQLRYKAVLFGEKNSFCKLYRYLREEIKFGKEEAWRTALRVKRGLSDTSQAGAFLKDKIYLQGFFAIAELNPEEIKSLYKGKFSLEHLHSKQFNLSDNNLIPAPVYLPSVYED